MVADSGKSSKSDSPPNGGVSIASASMLKMWQSRAMNKIGRGSIKKEQQKPAAGDDDVGLVHGAVRFPGSRRRPAKWAKTSADYSIPDVMHLLNRSWGVSQPASLISIIGAAADGPERIEQPFGESLKRAAQMTNAWILTDGAHEGIGGLVGSHVQPQICIGVQSWPALCDHGLLRPKRTTMMPRILHTLPVKSNTPSSLRDPFPSSTFEYAASRSVQQAAACAALKRSPSHTRQFLQQQQQLQQIQQNQHHLQQQQLQQQCSHQQQHEGGGSSFGSVGGSTGGSVGCSANSSFASMRGRSVEGSPLARKPRDELTDALHLDSYHSHFIFIDKDDQGRSTAGEFRSMFERHIISDLMSRDGYKVPSVTVVVNGDLDTLRTIFDRLQRGLPVVALGDTGGAASDLFNYSLTSTFTPEPSSGELQDDEYVREAATLIPRIIEEGASIGGSRKPKLSFFLANDEGNDLDFSIMQSMLNSCSSINEEIMLAVAWGDMAILEEVLERVPTHDHEGMSLALQLALGRRNKTMVEVLIDLAASPRFVAIERLFLTELNRYRLKGLSADQWRENASGSGKRKQQTRKRNRASFTSGVSFTASVSFTGSGNHGPHAPSATSDQKRSEPLEPAIKNYQRSPTFKSLSGVSFKQRGALAGLNGRGLSEAIEPFSILAEWVEGYNHSVQTRYLQDILVPSWTDLMLWAVLVSEEQLVLPLWAKTRDPLRAALLASKCCNRLSTLPHLRSDFEPLQKFAREYEDWAIGLLDAVDEPDAALPVLAMIPSVGSVGGGHTLWPNSCIELAVDIGGRFSPCRRFVAHRHSQYLLDSFFTGDFPNSLARVPVDARLIQILLQCLFFFVPGTFCEVMPVSGAAMERHDQVPTSLRRGKREAKSREAPPTHYQRVDDDVDDEDLDVWDDARLTRRPVTPHGEAGLQDIIDDIRSARWRYFFQVPKVKFVMYLSWHVGHLVLLVFVVFGFSGELETGLNPELSIVELCFWGWSLLFGIAELTELTSFDWEGVRMYLRSGWNKLDVSTLLCVIAVCVLRLTCDPGVPNERVPAGQCVEEVYSRNLYSLIMFLLYCKLLSYAQYSEMIGVHVIIMTQVLFSDVFVFGMLLLLVSCGIGSAFALLLARYDAQLEEGREFSRPFFIPFWALLEPPEVVSMEEQVGNELPTRITLPVVQFIYLIVVIVLINLLIAAMTDTYQRLRDIASLYWLNERSKLIDEFKRKGALPPPLNFFWILLDLMPRAWRGMCKRTVFFCARWTGWTCFTRMRTRFNLKVTVKKQQDGFKLLPGPEQQRFLYRRGRSMLKRYLHRRSKEQEKSLEHRLSTLHTRLDEAFNVHHKEVEGLRIAIVADRLERERRAMQEDAVQPVSRSLSDHGTPEATHASPEVVPKADQSAVTAKNASATAFVGDQHQSVLARAGVSTSSALPAIGSAQATAAARSRAAQLAAAQEPDTERRELRQEGLLNAQPVKVKAPSMRQKQKNKRIRTPSGTDAASGTGNCCSSGHGSNATSTGGSSGIDGSVGKCEPQLSC